MRARALCFNWCRHNLGFVGTEAGCDWTIPYVDCVSAMGVPNKYIGVPLFNLVYHDAVITPYQIVEGGRGGQKTATATAHKVDLRGLLNAGLPQVNGVEGMSKEDLAAMRRMSALHK